MAALTNYFSSHTLVNLALGFCVNNQCKVGVGMQIDETGCNGKTFNIDSLDTFNIIQLPDILNLIIQSCNVCNIRFIARTIINQPIFKD